MMNKKIFILDDDRGITDLLKMVFQLSSIDVVVENNSLTAYDSIHSIRPDIIIIDLWMPLVSGDLLIKNIRDSEELKDIFIICISASRNGKSVAMEAGADLFIPKPFDVQQILSAVEGALSQQISL